LSTIQQLSNILTKALLALLVASLSLAGEEQRPLQSLSKNEGNANASLRKKTDYQSIMRASEDKNLDLSRRSREFRKGMTPLSELEADKSEGSDKPTSGQRFFQSGGADIGGGSDWESFQPQEYPRRDLLTQALQAADQTIRTSHYPDAFKTLLLDELEHLAVENKFKYVPALFFVEQSIAGLQHSQRHAIAEFGTLGGLTAFTPGAFVYLSARTLNYSVLQLSQLIIHDTLHHVLSYALTTNDDLVTKLTESIAHQSRSQELADQMAHQASFQERSNKTCKLTDPVTAEKVIHIEIDRFTPYALGLNEETNSMEKIKDRRLTAFHMLPSYHQRNMWWQINQDLSVCGFEPVSETNQLQVERAGDVMALVLAKMYRQKQATFVRTSSKKEEQTTGIISQIILVRVD